VEERLVLPRRLILRWWLLVAWRELVRQRLPSEEEWKKLIRSVGAKKRAARKWTNYSLRPPPSLLQYAGGVEAGSSSRRRARSPSF
jgi:hypothetical protein